ncbi:MAG: 50S ribosomal protein L4 [Candidatus Riflebacteria bacterium]|nr:50S ribosomal protein L4 [Candidatus Riflebacteria bacterium]
MEIKKWNMKGSESGTLSVEDSVFGLTEEITKEKPELRPVSTQTIIDVVKAQLNNERLGTNTTKTRAEVAGGGRKPYRQKGTGRARCGSIRSPLFIGGGATFGPRPKIYDHRPPKKMVDRAISGILTDLAKEGLIRVVDGLGFKDGKTKSIKAFMKTFKIDKALFVVEELDVMFLRAVQNLKNVKVVTPRRVNSVDLLKFCPVYKHTQMNRSPGAKKNDTKEIVSKGALIISEKALRILESKARGIFDCDMEDFVKKGKAAGKESK